MANVVLAFALCGVILAGSLWMWWALRAARSEVRDATNKVVHALARNGMIATGLVEARAGRPPLDSGEWPTPSGDARAVGFACVAVQLRAVGVGHHPNIYAQQIRMSAAEAPLPADVPPAASYGNVIVYRAGHERAALEVVVIEAVRRRTGSVPDLADVVALVGELSPDVHNRNVFA